jgi:hypothetical protein
MSIDDGERIVAFARGTIAHALGGPAVEKPAGAWFERPAATFVTVTRHGRLHGCIGSVAPRLPLVDDVRHNALSAALRDPRSPPFQAAWLPEMGVEVTLLSALQPMRFEGEADAIAQLVPHQDGLVLRYGPSRGTFLPQVWDSLEDPTEFLAELKVKAGLPPDFWAPGVEIHRFSVQKWGDRLAGAPRAARDAHPPTTS